MNWNQYHRYARLDNFIRCLAAEYPDQATLFDIGKSYEGRVMHLLRITNNPSGGARIFDLTVTSIDVIGQWTSTIDDRRISYTVWFSELLTLLMSYLVNFTS